MSRDAEIIEKAVAYLEGELERGLGMKVKTHYRSDTTVVMELDNRSIRISNELGEEYKYNLILGLKIASKSVDNGQEYYYFPMRLIDALVAKISYDNKVLRGEVSNEPR